MTDVQALEARLYMQAGRRVPLTIVRGRGTRVWDDQGKEYLDFIAGIATNTLGHANPDLVDVISTQAQQLMHVSNIFYTTPQIDLAQLLIDNSPLDRVFFVSTGAEANEAAIKLARKWGKMHRDGAYEIISTHNSFHGRTMATISATGTPRYREPFEPGVPGFVFVDFDDVEALQSATTEQTTAVLIEPIQGEGGVNVPDPAYLRRVREWCDERNLLLILDEVQTGIGRTGTFWAHEQTGIEPDIMTTAKGLGGGVPIGAVLAKEHAAVFEPGDHGTTYGGNPLVCAAATHVVRTVLSSGFLETVRARSEQLTQGLLGLREAHSVVRGVRGQGLLLGLELGEEIAPDVVMAAIERGLLANPVRPDTVRVIPPLNLSAEDIDEAVGILDAALTAVGK